MKRIVFDIETEPFSDEFIRARTAKMRIKHVPKMRVACAFDESREEYRYFTPCNVAKLIGLLQSADEVVSFNGKCFDLLVLRKHYGLKGRTPRKGKHIDIHEIISAMAGFRVSLDKAVRANFGEKKHTNGREMSELDDKNIELACRSDVSHTHRLFTTFRSGTLLCPGKIRAWKQEESGSWDDTPCECPYCLALNSIDPEDCDLEEMSDGQCSDYLAGLWGTGICRNCGEAIDWGF
jgi:hypothetical protein